MSTNYTSPSTQSFYGRNLGRDFGAEDAPFVLARSLHGAELAVTEIRVDRPVGRLSDPIPHVHGYMICLMLSDILNNSYWEEGRQVSAYSLRAGDITIHDLRREPRAMMDKPFRSLLCYLPCVAFNALADQAGVPRISELHYTPGLAVRDETIWNIGLSLLPALRTPDRVSRLFIDHVTLALAVHAAQTYGGMETAPKSVKGGLAPWQEKRSKEMIAGDLGGTRSLQEIANTCGLSVSHFSRAFRKSTGLSPHAWLLVARVATAKGMLVERNASLTSVARACGFADQSHLSRVFKRSAGLSPGAWRKIALG